MTTKYFLAPNARWQGRDSTGQPVINGKLYTYVNNTVTPKATYQDYEAKVANANPVILDGKGEANIYWANDELYSIVLKTSADATVYSQNNYPVVDSNSETNPTVTVVTNLARNPQFTTWTNGTSFSPVNNAANRYDYVCDDWIFERSNTSATIEISKGVFAIDQTTVPANPVNYFHLNCTAGGSGETFRRASQYYNSVKTLAGKTVVVSFYAQSSTLSEIGVTLRQYFGTGGSPSATVTTQLSPLTNLTNSWTQHTYSVAVPGLSGKTAGSNGDDALILDFNFTTNSAGIVDIANVQFQIGDEDSLTEFPYFTPNDQYKHLDSSENESLWSTGDYKHTLATTAPPGWVICNDGTIGNPQSGATNALVRCKALFILLYGNVSNTYAPIYNSDGTVGSRTSAEADWNLNKRLALTRTLGRVLSGYNPTPSPLFTYTFNSTNVTNSSGILITLADTSSLYTGTKVRFTTSTGSLPTNLSAGVDYYVINVSATTIRVATSLANAVAGSAIAYVDSGTVGAIFSIISQPSAHALGSYVGEDTHASTKAEMPSHAHTASTEFKVEARDAPAGATNLFEPGIGSPQNATVGDTGNSAAHNNIQPTLYTNIMLKL